MRISKLTLFTGVLLISFNSCQQIKFALAVTLYGVKKPKIRTTKELKRYSEKIGLTDYEHYKTDFNGFIQINGLNNSVNSILIFNQQLE